jgi:short-subunit dehydrogenase
MIASVAGRLGPVLRTAYAAAKHGLIGYGDALRAEVETAYGIQVTNVLPGSVRTRVAANALQGDGSARGASDANIEAGMEPAECARRILDGIAEGRREILVAEGAEAFAASLRFADPGRLFDLLAKEGARLAEARAQGARPEPHLVNRTLPES